MWLTRMWQGEEGEWSYIGAIYGIHYILFYILVYLILKLSLYSSKIDCLRDFSGGPVVKNLPYNAGDVGSTPSQGTKILHAVGQLSLHATTTELMCLNERAHMPQTTEPTCYGAHAPQLQSPCALEPEHQNYRREKPATTTREKPACCNEEPTCCSERSRMPRRRSCVPQLRSDAVKNK